MKAIDIAELLRKWAPAIALYSALAPAVEPMIDAANQLEAVAKLIDQYEIERTQVGRMTDTMPNCPQCGAPHMVPVPGCLTCQASLLSEAREILEEVREAIYTINTQGLTGGAWYSQWKRHMMPLLPKILQVWRRGSGTGD